MNSLQATSPLTKFLLKWSGCKVIGRQDNSSYLLKHGKLLFEVTPLTLAEPELLTHLDWLGNTPSVPVCPAKINRSEALPADFSGVPFETFIVCDNYFQGYLQTQQDYLLDEIGRVCYQDTQLRFQLWHPIAIFYLAHQNGVFSHAPGRRGHGGSLGVQRNNER